jgi:HEAT repeat protein
MEEQQAWFAANRDQEAVRSRTLRLALDGFGNLDGAGRAVALDFLSRAPSDWMLTQAESVSALLGKAGPFTEELERFVRRLMAARDPRIETALLTLAGESPSHRAASFLSDYLSSMSIEDVIRLGSHDSHRVRVQVAHTLKAFEGDVRVPTSLLQLLEDSDSLVRGAALRSLAALKDERVLGLLDGVLKSEDSALRLRGIEALAAVTGEQGVPRLVEIYRAGDLKDRWAVIQALPRAGGSAAVGALAALCRETGATYPIEALSALLSMDEPEVSNALLTILERSPSTDLKGMAMEGLVQREGANSAETLRTYLGREDTPVLSRIALLSMARLGITESLSGLLKAMQKPEGDEAAERALADLTYFEASNPSPPLRAKEYEEWATTNAERTRDEWFLLASERAGVSLDVSVPWLSRPKLDIGQYRSLMELLQLGNRPLRQAADRILGADAALMLPPIGDDAADVEGRVEAYRLALREKKS